MGLLSVRFIAVPSFHPQHLSAPFSIAYTHAYVFMVQMMEQKDRSRITKKKEAVYLMAKETKVFSIESYTKQQAAECIPDFRCNVRPHQSPQRGAHVPILMYL